MGNILGRRKKDEELITFPTVPLDLACARWFARDLARNYGFTPRKPRAIKPPDHYIEYMQMNGWLDLDLDDRDLARLFK